MKKITAWNVVGLLALLGIVLAVYLLYNFYVRPAFTPCYVNAKVNCDAVIKGPVSTLFGIPTALYGLTGYILILIASFKKWKRVLLGVATFGLLFCLRLTIIEVFYLKVYCPVCLTCQLDMLIVFILGLKLLKEKPRTTG